MSTLSIIIVNWNTRELIVQCLSSLSTLKGKTEIIVVDNASSDGSPDAVLELFPWVKLIQNSKNFGYAAGNNIGAGVASGEYFLLLNSDTIPKVEAILEMVTFLDNNHEISVIGPFLRLGNGEAQVGAAGWDLTIKSAFNYQMMLHR